MDNFFEIKKKFKFLKKWEKQGTDT